MLCLRQEYSKAEYIRALSPMARIGSEYYDIETTSDPASGALAGLFHLEEDTWN